MARLCRPLWPGRRPDHGKRGIGLLSGVLSARTASWVPQGAFFAEDGIIPRFRLDGVSIEKQVTPIQFGLRNVPLTAVDILIVWTTLPWCAVAVWPFYNWVAVAQVPYFVRVSIATVLQLSITAMNAGS